MSQQEFNLRLGYLKYKEMKPIKELLDLSYAEAAVKQAGRKMRTYPPSPTRITLSRAAWGEGGQGEGEQKNPLSRL